MFVSVEGCLLEPLTVSGFIVMGWNILSRIGLKCDDYISEQTTILLVSLSKGSIGLSLNGALDPEMFCTWIS